MADIIKGICILFVVITHFSWSAAERRFFLFPFWIDMAVPAFMIISGYVYALSFERRQTGGMKMAYAPLNVKDKLIRYTIPFAAACLTEVILIAVKYAAAPEAGLLTEWVKGGLGPGSYYYFLMIQFIFLFPVIYFIICRYGSAGLLICGGINVCYELFQYSINMGEGCYRLLIFRYFLLIAFGCYLCVKKRNFNRSINFFVFFCGLGFIILITYAGYVPKIIRYWSGTSFLASMYIMPVVGRFLISPGCAALRSRPLEELGRASYHIFLVQMVYYRFLSGLVYRGMNSRVMAFVFGDLLCILGGYLFYKTESRLTPRYMVWMKMLGKSCIKKFETVCDAMQDINYKIKWRQ